MDIYEILLACLRRGPHTSWNEFARVAGGDIRSAAARVLLSAGRHSSENVEDRTQDVFLSLFTADFKSLREFRGQNAVSLRAYLRTITTNSVYTWLEKERNTPKESLDDLNPAAPVDDPSLPLLVAAIEKCLESEKERDRIIFWLKNRQGYTPDQIAALPGLGLKKDGVETVLTRLLKAVALCMKKIPRRSEGLSR